MTSTVVSVAPTAEPVTELDAREQLSISFQDDDPVLARQIVAARLLLEDRSGGAFITQTIVTKLDGGFPAEFQLPHWPLRSVSSITYLDVDGNSQTLATSEYDVDADTRPGRVIPAYNVTWPITRSTLNAVTVTYLAGHGAANTDVPAPIREAILLLVGHLYCNRDGTGDLAAAVMRSLELMKDYVAGSAATWEFV